MPLKVIRFATLLLAALGLTMGAAHVREPPAKLNYDAQTYAAVNRTGTAGRKDMRCRVGLRGRLAGNVLA